MNEQSILFEYKVWGAISVNNYRRKQRYKVFGLLLFILPAALLFFFKINGWLISIVMAVAGPFIIVFEQRRQTTLQLSAAELTIFNRKEKTTVKLEAVGSFRFCTYDEEDDPSYILVAISYQKEQEINLNNMPVWKIRKLLTLLHHMGYDIYLPYEALPVQDSAYYLPR